MAYFNIILKRENTCGKHITHVFLLLKNDNMVCKCTIWDLSHGNKGLHDVEKKIPMKTGDETGITTLFFLGLIHFPCIDFTATV